MGIDSRPPEMPPLKRCQQLPLHAKLAACVTLGGFALVVALLLATPWMLSDDEGRTAAQAQAALVDEIAHELDEKVSFRLRALALESAVLAHELPLGVTSDTRTAALEEFFANRPVLDALFDRLLLIDANGQIVQRSSRGTDGIGIDRSSPYDVQQVLRSGLSVVGEPFASQNSGVIDLAVPVRDDTGATVGALIGQIDLKTTNFISEIGQRRFGHAGVFVLVGQRDVVIASPDGRQLMQHLSPIEAADLHAAGRDASTAMHGQNNGDGEMLASYRSLIAAPWVLRATSRTSDAHALLHSRGYAVLAAGSTAPLVLGLIAWLVAARLLRPLDDLRRAMRDDASAGTASEPLRAEQVDLASLLDAYRTQAERRHNAEVSLAKSERRLHDIADNIPALVAYVDRQQRYSYTNARYKKVLGYVDTIGKTMLEVVGHETHAALLPYITRAYAGETQQFERPFWGPDGDGQVLVDYVPAFDANGAVEGFYVMMIDITARKGAEARLAISERRLRSIADNLPAMIGYVDREERYRFLNANYERVFGAAPDTLLGKNVRELMGDAGYAEVKVHVDAALRGEQQHFERFGPRADSQMYAMVDYIPDIAANGSVEGYYVMVLDISARRRAELALAASERRVRAIADNMPALIAHYDRDERLTFVNAAVGQLHGMAPEQIVGMTLRELRGAETYPLLRPHAARVLSGVPVTFEVDGLMGDEVRHYSANYVPDLGADGTVQGFYALTLDITERKRVESSLLRSEQRVRTIADNLPAMISHFDREGRYTFANRTVGDVFGRDIAGLMGQTIREVRGNAIADVVEPQMALAMAGEIAVFETTAPFPDGGLQHFQATYLPEVDFEGEVQGVYALTFDITERKRADIARLASERRLQDLINIIPATVAYFDMAQRCQYANDTALHLLGVERSEVQGMAMRAMLGERFWGEHAPHLDDVLAGGRARFQGKVPFHSREAHYQAHMIPDRDTSDAQRGYYLMTFDITALKEAEHRQERVEAQLRSVTDNLPVLISYVDRDFHFTFLNKTFDAWLGIATASVLGRHVRDVIGQDMFAEREPYFERAFVGERVEFEVTSTTQIGVRHLKTVYVPDIEADGTVAGAYCLSSDVTEMKNAELQLGLLVRSDALTGLANRYRFNEALPESLARARRSGTALALMFLDIDRFKQINDQLGHSVGDEALQEFASRLQQSVRVTDLVARLAGDEFVIILECLHSETAAREIASKILTAINRPFILSHGPLTVTTSLGIAYRPDSRIGEDSLLARADEALYQAKAAGRNTYRLLVAA